MPSNSAFWYVTGESKDGESKDHSATACSNAYLAAFLSLLITNAHTILINVNTFSLPYW